MKLRNSIILILLVFIFSFLFNKFVYNLYIKKHKMIKILSKGNGGDKNGSILLHKFYTSKKINSKLIEDINEIQNNDKIVIFIGQGAVLDYISNQEKLSKIENIYLYSHIINKEIAEIAKNNTNIKLITTESEANIHKNLEYKITKLPLAIPTFIKNEGEKSYNQEKIEIDNLLKNKTIHLGGNYKNSNGEDVFIKEEVYKNLLKNLKLENKKDEISIIIHPRTFSDLNCNLEKIKQRMINIKNNQNVLFFLPKQIFEIIKNNKNENKFDELKINLSPSYIGIVYAINNNNTNDQFISADQYNAFSDINKKIIPFLLNDKDINQTEYIKIYKNKFIEENKIGDNLYKILKEFIKIAKSPLN